MKNPQKAMNIPTRWLLSLLDICPKNLKSYSTDTCLAIYFTCIFLVLNSSIKIPKKEIMSILWHTVASQKMKYLIMMLTTVIKELNNENFVSLKKGIQKTLEYRKMSHAHGLVGWVTIVKMAILPKAIYRFSVILIRNPISIFTKTPKKFTWNNERS